MNPLNAIGAVTMHFDEKDVFLGTAFCYKSSRFLLSSSHVIPDNPRLIAVTFPYTGKILVPTKMARHDNSDVVALSCTEGHVNNRDVEGIECFQSITKDLKLADDFITYGYPEDISMDKKPTPTPRVFKGYFQRFFTYSSSRGKYPAIELNIPCPKGLSGSPIMVYGNVSSIVGIVSENVETSSELHEEEKDASEKFIYRKVINYGVAVRLSDVEEWIEEHYAERDS